MHLIRVYKYDNRNGDDDKFDNKDHDEEEEDDDGDDDNDGDDEGDDNEKNYGDDSGAPDFTRLFWPR